MQKNEIKQSDMKPLIIDSSWTERFLPDPPREKDNRPPFRRDRGRILHSAAFRCLQAKTQIHAIGENDFYRTRLTHFRSCTDWQQPLLHSLNF